MTKSYRRLRFRIIAALCLLVAVCGAARGQEQPLKINYHLAMSHPNTHLFEVSIDVEVPLEEKIDSLDFQMPKWSPGRYAVFDFAKNVQEFRAQDLPPPNARCEQALSPVARLDSDTWRVFLCGGKRVTVSYNVFGNDLSGTFSQLDTRHGNFNGGSIFVYIAGHKPDPVKLIIDPPPGWRIVNGWTERSDLREWEFPNWDVMIDTPTEIGPDWTEDWFDVDGKKYRVMVHSLGEEGGKRAV